MAKLRIVVTGNRDATTEEKVNLANKALSLLRTFPDAVLVSGHGVGADEAALVAATTRARETKRPISDFLEEILPRASQKNVEQYMTNRASGRQALMPVDVTNPAPFELHPRQSHGDSCFIN